MDHIDRNNENVYVYRNDDIELNNRKISVVNDLGNNAIANPIANPVPSLLENKLIAKLKKRQDKLKSHEEKRTNNSISGIYARIFPDKAANLSKAVLEKIEQETAKLDKILNLIKKYPKKDPVDGTSFEEFLGKFFPQDLINNLTVAKSKNLGQLVECADLFEKKQSLDKTKKDIEVKETVLSNDPVLGPIMRNHGITSVAKSTQDKITRDKLTKAKNKLKSHQKKYTQNLDKLRDLGITDPNSAQQIIAAQRTQDANIVNLKQELEDLTVNPNTGQKKIADDIKERTREIKDQEATVEELKKSNKSVREQISKLLDPDMISGERKIERAEEVLTRFQTELKELNDKKTDLEKKRLKIRKNIEKNQTSIPQLIDSLKKRQTSIAALELSIDELEGKLSREPLFTAEEKITKLKAQNSAKQKFIDLVTANIPEDIFSEDLGNEETLNSLRGLLNRGENDELRGYATRYTNDIAANNEVITELEPIAVQQKAIQKLLNPHADEIETRQKAIDKDMKELKKAVPDLEFLPEFKQEIDELKEKNKLLEKDMAVAQTDTIDVITVKKQNEAQYKVNNDLLNKLQLLVKNIDTKQKEIDAYYDQVLTEDEFDIEKEILEKKIATPPVDPNAPVAPDLRAGSFALDKWQDKQINSLTNPVTVDPKNTKDIHIFGTYNKRPTHAKYNPDKSLNLNGEYLGLNEENLKAIGRNNKNNFLSNGYEKPFKIDGIDYKSVTHYMLLKRIEKEREKITIEQPRNAADRLKCLKVLEEDYINKSSTAYDANKWAELQYKTYHVYFETPLNIFTGMDDELKKALYYKFIGPDGKPNEEGKMLLATGNTNLYAGYELGDPTYGMEFTKKGKMEGQNKLGVCLMELRETLRKKEKKSNEYGRLLNPPHVEPRVEEII